MKKIILKHNGCGDTRNAPKDTTFKQFHEANLSHIKDVKSVMYYLAKRLGKQGQEHDWTKLEFEEEFWKDFQNSLLNNADFVNAWWYQMHIKEERHHPTSYCHEDINLLDIIEMIVDCICAGKARAGKVRQLEINDAILKKAFDNTVKLVDDITEVKE